MSDANLFRFSAFELDPKSGELRKDGDPVKLPPQPFKVLTLLAQRSGELLTRKEVREQIWSEETFVDFDQGLKTRTRLRDFMIAARALLEGNAAESLEAVDRVVSSDFRDPEGLFSLTRHFAHLKQTVPALAMFRRVVAGGFVCFPAMERDPWLDPVLKTPEFAELLGQAEVRHREAAAAFARMQGSIVLGVGAPIKDATRKPVGRSMSL